MKFDFNKFKENIVGVIEGAKTVNESSTTEKVGFEEGLNDGVVFFIMQVILATQNLAFAEAVMSKVQNIKMFLPANIEELVYLDEIEVACSERIALLKNS